MPGNLDPLMQAGLGWAGICGDSSCRDSNYPAGPDSRSEMFKQSTKLI